MQHLSGEALLDALERGEVRAATPGADGWQVHAWVKQGILDIFRSSPVVAMDGSGLAHSPSPFRDKMAFPVRAWDAASEVRVVPGGSAIRRGAYLGPGVVCMPPMYVNVGAHIGAGSMIDSHALVGSCAQVGEDVHVSAAVQIGGVLEPIGAQPVIVEDGAFLGGGVGLYEGICIGRRAVLAAGVILTASTRVFDLVHEVELRGQGDAPLRIPENAVVVPGSRPAGGDFAQRLGLALGCAVIVKYRDSKTDANLALEQALRG
ncbi:MAG: 2,3,4,5-tetrahydropyridine-2,6-dicarboxylate N-succinyltransferase [Planctomycetes bacterium]|nr:2,3,4,5-tetrahydropyridine-2,6-dicarboxylate N-succinyltransferase [Planctomycetota bacterium]HPF15251.1 2,3,4,5-tetrahydropyridine-2,6-dicarboxylate N-succinyltransferase [Planctomycetota bacterium]